MSDPNARVTYALSSAQRRLWFMSRWAERDPHYNVTLVWQIQFRVDVSALRTAIHELVARHEILRTRYPVVDGVPRQEVAPPEAWELSCVDEPLADGDDRDEVIARFVARVARTPLDLERGPVFAATLLRVARDDYVMAAVLHHVAIDQWSINILTEELELLYTACAEARSPDLLPTVPYREYAAWEVAQLAQHEDRLRCYWEHQLADCPSLLTPPYDRDQQSRHALSGSEYQFAVNADMAERLRWRAREQRTSMFAMTFGLYAVLLARWTGSERMTIGTTVAFRHPRFRRTVGCFVNPLAIMLDLRERTRFDSVLGHVTEQVFGGLSNAQYPFDLLVQRVRALHPGHTGELVTAYMQFQPVMLSPAEREGQRFRVDLTVHNGRAKFPLMLNMSQRRTGLDCTFEYDSERFSEARIRALADDYVHLLTVASTDPTRLVRRVALQADRRRPDRSTDVGSAVPPLPASSAARSRSSLSGRLADIWRELLLVDSVPPDSDFFALGGHSLLLATLAWRIKQEFRAHLRVGELYDASQFEDMAALIADAPLRSDLAVFQSAVSVERVGGIPCQLELGLWTREGLDQLFASAGGLKDGQRMRHFATALIGTPFQFESLRPLPLPGRLPVRLGALDCITFVYTSLAMAAGRNFEEFVKWLYLVRYAQAGDRVIDSHPETGNIFDFAEESLLVNAVERGLLLDVTTEVAGDHAVIERAVRLAPAQRSYKVDRAELWSTPKFGSRPIAWHAVRAADLRAVSGGLHSGDLILMSRAQPYAAHVVDHLALVEIDEGEAFALQATQHFAWRPDATAKTAPQYTGVFYGADGRREQIGVAIAPPYAGNALTLKRDGMELYAYVAGERRALVDYANSNFAEVSVLRPTVPARARLA